MCVCVCSDIFCVIFVLFLHSKRLKLFTLKEKKYTAVLRKVNSNLVETDYEFLTGRKLLLGIYGRK